MPTGARQMLSFSEMGLVETGSPRSTGFIQGQQLIVAVLEGRLRVAKLPFKQINGNPYFYMNTPKF